MNPVHFGTGERRLFGLYTPARSAATGERAIVLCHPWGQEYLRAHRSVRQLSVMLAGVGYHALRFDYFGTGDSFGDATESDLAGWEADIESAIEELRDTTGVARVSLAGMRIGGALAAKVAVRHPGLIDRLVLWDAVLSGTEYLDELRAVPSLTRSGSGARLSNRAAPDEGREVRGFPLTPRLIRDIEAIDLVALADDLPKRTLLLASQQQPSQVRMASTLASHDHPAMMEQIDAAPAWLEDRNYGAGAIPVRLLHRIANWLRS